MTWVTSELQKSNPLFARKDFYDLVALGKIPGYSIIQKFGRSTAVGTTVVPIAIGNVWPTPTAGVNLEVVSDDAADTAAGLGARNILIQGLGEQWQFQEEELATNGTSASLATTNKFTRIFRLKVTKSGRYASQTASSQSGTLTVRVSGGGATWGQIDEIATNFGVGQSQIACYSIPVGYTGILKSKFTSADVTQAANIYFFQRPNIDVITAPFEGMRLVQQETGVKEIYNITPVTPINVFPEKTDIGFMGKTTAGTASISCNFELLLIENSLL